MKKIFLALSLFLSTAVCAEEPDPSFDCTKATTNIEKIICSDRVLSKLDSEMTSTYKKLLESFNQENQNKLSLNQKEWLRFRDTYCGFTKYFNQNKIDIHKACLKSKYEDRIEYLTGEKIANNIDKVLVINDQIVHPFCLTDMKNEETFGYDKLKKCNDKNKKYPMEITNFTEVYFSDNNEPMIYYELKNQNTHSFSYSMNGVLTDGTRIVTLYQQPGNFTFTFPLIITQTNDSIKTETLEASDTFVEDGKLYSYNQPKWIDIFASFINPYLQSRKIPDIDDFKEANGLIWCAKICTSDIYEISSIDNPQKPEKRFIGYLFNEDDLKEELKDTPKEMKKCILNNLLTFPQKEKVNYDLYSGYKSYYMIKKQDEEALKTQLIKECIDPRI